MSRRQKLTRRNLDFTIHEDDPYSGMQNPDSDIRDFGMESGAQPETPAATNEATDSNLTKASTLVNEDVQQLPSLQSLKEQRGEEKTEGLEQRLDSMLEELKGEIRGAERLVEKGMEDEERRESCDSWDVGDDNAGLGASELSHGTYDDHTEGESMLTTETHDAPTEESASRRESTLSAATHDDGTEGSASRRESALSSASWQSDRRRTSLPADDSILSHEPADDSILSHEDTHDNGTQASSSRRASTYEDHEHSLLDDERTEDTASRRDSIGSQDDTRRRASERTEALIQAAARGIVEQIGGSAQSSRAGERAEEDTSKKGSARASPNESVRSSAAHHVLPDEEESQSKRYSGRPFSEMQPRVSSVYSLDDDKLASKLSSARSSAAHEAVAAEDDVQSKMSTARLSFSEMQPRVSSVYSSDDAASKLSSARPSAAHGSVTAEDQTQSRASTARSSEAHGSVIAEDEIESKALSARPSDVHEPASKQSSARPSEAHEPVSAGDETRAGFSSARHSEAEERSSSQPSTRASAAHESYTVEDIVESIEQDVVDVVEEDEPPVESAVQDIVASIEEDEVPTESVVQDIVASIEEDEQPISMDEEAGTSSHNENDDDVFSDHSPRSSVGSLSAEEHQPRKLSEHITQRTSFRSPRPSDFSHYDTDDQEEAFIPMVRGTPRPPFRSPSSVKAMQMSSPPASVIGSSRSSRRTPLPTVSRLGSPSAQYSPKKTPPRFRKTTPPLVLLHVTLLPLRWPWGDVLDVTQMDELSENGKGLREAWRQLQERMGDTTCERGILLPHPQNDFEVLEERLLEALELPLQRRARILDCGHYLGPSNDLTILSDSESDDEDYYHASPRRSRSSAPNNTHWCGTCRSEIRYDSLGIGKVFRVKVYASNGLIKAGAWEACWKEMERVDVEIEPIVETEVHEELVRLDAEQQRAVELHQEETQRILEEEELAAEQLLAEAEEEETTQLHHDVPPSSPPEIRITSEPEPPTVDEERRLRDEARLREIYGHSPAPSEPTTAAQPPSSEYVDHRTPPSPSAEAYARREERRYTTRTESLPQLILEALKVMMQDRRNVVIALMSVLVLALAMRTGGVPSNGGPEYQPIVKRGAPIVESVQEVTDSVVDVVQSVTSAVENVASSVAPIAEEPISASEEVDPWSSASSQGYDQAVAEQETIVSQTIVTVVETMTETSFETATVTASEEAQPESSVFDDVENENTSAEEELLEAVDDVLEDVEPTVAVVEEVVLEQVMDSEDVV